MQIDNYAKKDVSLIKHNTSQAKSREQMLQTLFGHMPYQSDDGNLASDMSFVQKRITHKPMCKD